MKKIHFIASVNDEQIEDIAAIARRLEVLGCTIDNVLPFSGVITGSTVSTNSFEALKIDGIKYIEPDRDVQSRGEMHDGM